LSLSGLEDFWTEPDRVFLFSCMGFSISFFKCPFVFYSEIFFKSMELEFINLKMFDVFDFNAWRLDG